MTNEPMTHKASKTSLVVAAACWLSVGVLLVSLPQPVLAGQTQQSNKAQQPARIEKCPACRQDLVTVPILIGMPSKETVRQLELGRALVGGCVGNPGKPEQAFVCLKCRKWKTKQMRYWQPLPKDFGKANKAGKADSSTHAG